MNPASAQLCTGTKAKAEEGKGGRASKIKLDAEMTGEIFDGFSMLNVARESLAIRLAPTMYIRPPRCSDLTSSINYLHLHHICPHLVNNMQI